MSFSPISNVELWHDTPAVSDLYCLENAIMIGIGQTSTTDTGFFENIWIPVKISTENGMPDDYTYVNIGMDFHELAECYFTLYGKNFIVEPLVEGQAFGYINAVGKLGRRIKTVFELNKGKYLKLIELQGYAYNPLWNVDGSESFTYLENAGTTDKKTSHAIDRAAGATSSQTETTDINLYDDNPRQAQKVTTSGSGSSTQTGAAANNYDDEVYTHHNALNGTAEYSGGVDEFGNTVVGGDKYHTEKKTRQGNIGVTKSTELIEAQREVVRFNIIQEFFDDINKQILVGVF